jgi:hypothetical protein
MKEGMSVATGALTSAALDCGEGVVRVLKWFSRECLMG